MMRLMTEIKKVGLGRREHWDVLDFQSKMVDIKAKEGCRENIAQPLQCADEKSVCRGAKLLAEWGCHETLSPFNQAVYPLAIGLADTSERKGRRGCLGVASSSVLGTISCVIHALCSK